jgi:predicted acetyltransferase
MKIEVIQATLEDKPILQRMMEFYQYDFSEYDESDLDSQGTFGYAWLDHYWREQGRYPFIVRVDGKLAGFVLVNQFTYLSNSEWSIAEFFIMRKYRREGIGKTAAFFIFDKFRGVWEIHQLENNQPSQHFWRKVISEYTHGQYSETLLNNESSRGPIQQFDNMNKEMIAD